MHEQEIRVSTPDGEMTTFVVHPDDGGRVGGFPISLLYTDAVGYREQLKENARRFGGSRPTVTTASRRTSSTARARS